MTIGWLASFGDVPWSRVLGMAPSLAERAKKLWSARRKDEPALALPAAGADAVSALEIRVHALERQVSGLGEEMASSFEVVSAITDQHSELIRAVDVLLVRTRGLLRACVLLGIALIAVAILAAMR